MHRKNSDVDSSEKLISLIEKLKGPIIVGSCQESYSDDAPSFTMNPNLRWKCWHSVTNKERISECLFTPSPSSERKQRLCFCHYSDNE